MHFSSVKALLARLAVVGAILLGTNEQVLRGQDARDRALSNAWEIHQELVMPAAAGAVVKDHFPTFLEYHDLVMFHPKFGYYASGRVSFTSDYRTYPIVMAPLFGHMVAEQIFFMWDGMRKAGTLGEREQFTIAEFGAGDGALAESILDYLDQRAKDTDPRWKQFRDQVIYVCYDRSPALNNTQRKRNARFGARFAARIADATNPTATIQPGSLKGVVLSNELPDAFSVQKIILPPSGAPEVAFVVPFLAAADWATIRRLLVPEIARAVEANDATVEKTFFSGKADPTLYLTRTSFVALLENLLTTKAYESSANALQFREVYVPVSVIPDLAAHLRRYAPVYAAALARDPRGMVTYVNPGAESFIQGSGQILRAGYVLTIDYGSTWDGILAENSYPHFRTYGPAQRANQIAQQDPNSSNPTGDTSEPYLGPTLNDFTTDANFSLLAAEGQLVGLKPLYFGSQKALQTGTSVTLDDTPPERERDGSGEEFRSWAKNFVLPSVYKVFVQQKEGTDDTYRFPDQEPEPLGLDRSNLTEEQLRLAAEIELRLITATTPAPSPVR